MIKVEGRSSSSFDTSFDEVPLLERPSAPVKSEAVVKIEVKRESIQPKLEPKVEPKLESSGYQSNSSNGIPNGFTEAPRNHSTFISSFDISESLGTLSFENRVILTTSLSNRSHCRGCKELIYKGYPRVGYHARQRCHMITKWYHPSCFLLHFHLPNSFYQNVAAEAEIASQDGMFDDRAIYEQAVAYANTVGVEKWNELKAKLAKSIQRQTRKIDGAQGQSKAKQRKIKKSKRTKPKTKPSSSKKVKKAPKKLKAKPKKSVPMQVAATMVKLNGSPIQQ